MKLQEIEIEILKHWKQQRIYQKVQEKNKGGKPFYFLDGPPYTSGKVHVGTAWNKVLKDAILRYKRMQGHKVFDRAGYDMHGLPTENATQRKLGLQSKEDIEKFGIRNFVQECKKLCIENMHLMNEDFKRLGVWMDFENAYQSISNEFIEGVWWFTKEAYRKKRLYEGYRSIAWDWYDETACAKHELEYKSVTDESIFVKFPVKKSENTFLLIWTTTPWTIAYNLGVMVNPELLYVKCKAGSEVWILAKDLVEQMKERTEIVLEVISEFSGEALVGMEYVHPFSSLLAKQYAALKEKHQNVHTVVLSKEFVTAESGTGLVHMAPGCGPEDYEVGHRNNIPPWNTILPNGYYPEDMGELGGKHAKRDNDVFTEKLDALGYLVAREKYEHEYPFAQRSKQPVIFRATKQWFLKIEDLKEQMITENDKVNWVPKAAYNAFDAWLRNLRDNSVSKQRYWGIPLPIWRNGDELIVIGSVRELQEASGKRPEELHIPDIDEIVIEKDGKTFRRVPDVFDVWVDAGSAAWNALNFPQQKELFESLYPADVILEGKDQIRGWFNLLMVESMVALDRPAFKAAYMHGFVQDAQGRKMSKSLGNVISPYEIIDKYGADTFRFYTIGGTKAAVDLHYNFEDLEAKARSLIILWNLHSYLLDLADVHHINPTTVNVLEEQYGKEEIAIRALAAKTVKECTVLFEQYRLDEIPPVIEQLFLGLSRDYIQWKREAVAEGKEMDVILHTVWETLWTCLRLLAPVCPMVTEKIFLNIKKVFGLNAESIHLVAWPEQREGDKHVLEDIIVAKEAIQAILATREKLGYGTRWPLKEVFVETPDIYQRALQNMEELIMRQTNVKQLHIVSQFTQVKLDVKPDFRQLGPDFGDKAPAIIAKLATESPQSLLQHIEKEGFVKVNVGGMQCKILKKHLLVSRVVEAPFQEAEAPKFMVFASGERTEELDAEGFARELIRRFQQFRKEVGLKKQDEVKAYIQTDEDVLELLGPWKELMKKRIGASVFEIGAMAPDQGHKHKEVIIRKESFQLFLHANHL